MKKINILKLPSTFLKLSLFMIFTISSCNQAEKQPLMAKSTSNLESVNKAAAQVVKTIDKRTMTSVDGNVYFLVFIAKPTLLNGGKNAGHAYTVWGVEDNARLMSYAEAWGLYPKNTMESLILGEVPGILRNEGITSSSYNRMIVKVDKAVYDKAVAKKKEWAAKGTYQLITRDCLSFTIDIASIAGLKIPAREGFDNVPWQYLQSLTGSN